VAEVEQADEEAPAPVVKVRAGSKKALILDALDSTGGDVKGAVAMLAEASVTVDTAYCYHVKNGPWTAMRATAKA
jgi:hypothetical protein